MADNERLLLSGEMTFKELQRLYPEKDICAMMKWLSLAGATANVCLVDEMFDMKKVHYLLGEDPCKEFAIGDIIQTFQSGTYVVTAIPINRDDVVVGIKTSIIDVDRGFHFVDIREENITMSDAIFLRKSRFNIDALLDSIKEAKPHLEALRDLYNKITSMEEKE